MFGPEVTHRQSVGHQNFFVTILKNCQIGELTIICGRVGTLIDDDERILAAVIR